MQVITETLYHIITYQASNKRFKHCNWQKSFFDLPVKNEEEAYKKIVEMSNNNDYTTGNQLDFAYFKEHCRLIAVDLSKLI